jgi:NodT family efflux transporter outer membrane factor (OMF) lipoprotein
LSIEGSVAKLYWQLAYLNQKIQLGEQSVAYARKTLDLIRVQYRAGAVSQLEVLSSERNLASQEATQEDLLQQRMVARNAMAIMFDAPPSAHISDEPQTLPNSTPPAMATALPAEVLARRPDLQAAELRLRQSLGNINVARANFYPTFNLSARVGTGANTLSQILSDPIGALALNLALPFLNWNENQLNLKISKAAYEQNAVNFRQTLYTALQEVDNALSAQNQLRLQGEKQRLAWQNAQKAERLYEVRYRAGGDSLKSWLDAQEARRQAESAYLLNRYNQYINQVDLIMALGG